MTTQPPRPRIPVRTAPRGRADSSAPATAALQTGGRWFDGEAAQDPRRRRPCVTTRGRALDRRRPGHRQRTRRIPWGQGDARRHPARRWQAGAADQSPAPAHPLPQAGRRGDDTQRSAREADGVRQASRTRPGPVDRGRTAGLHYHRAAPVHRRRRAGPPTHAPELRDRTRVRGPNTRRTDPPGTRVAHRRGDPERRGSAVRDAATRGWGGVESMVPRRHSGGPQPRGAATLRGGGLYREPTHPRALRTGDVASPPAPRAIRKRGRR